MPNNKESTLLAMCAWCKSIRISENPKTWLKQEDNPELYKTLVKKYEQEKITHGICKPCMEKHYPDVNSL